MNFFVVGGGNYSDVHIHILISNSNSCAIGMPSFPVKFVFHHYSSVLLCYDRFLHFNKTNFFIIKRDRRNINQLPHKLSRVAFLLLRNAIVIVPANYRRGFLPIAFRICGFLVSSISKTSI